MKKNINKKTKRKIEPKKETELFVVGKNISKQNLSKSVFTVAGSPKSQTEVRWKDNGKLHRVRQYDEIGKAKKDYEYIDKTNSYEHLHDFDFDVRSKEHRQPNKQEKRFFKKTRSSIKKYDK